MKARCPAVCLFGLLLLGQAGCTSKQIYGNLYEGVRVRNQLQTTPAEQIGKPDVPSYDQYEAERKRANAP